MIYFLSVCIALVIVAIIREVKQTKLVLQELEDLGIDSKTVIDSLKE